MGTLDVAVNLLWLAPGRVGGSEEYLVRQLIGLGDDPALAVTLYVQPAFPQVYPALADQHRTVVAPLQRDWRPARVVVEHAWLGRRTRGVDVVHHGGGTAPAGGRAPTLVTVHDLQYLAFPQYFGPVRRAYLTASMPPSMRRATVVATPSEYVRGRVIEVFGRDPASVVVVPHGVPSLHRPVAAAVDAALTAHGVRRPYLVYPAITHPHKGHAVLVGMLRESAAPGHPLHDLQLVLIGGPGAAEGAVCAAIDAAGVGHRVVRPGRVPAADRDALIAGAEALVFPSEYEGFGAPLVEAMALGVPVVASDHPAVTEVLGGAGVIVTERSGAAWAAAVAHARRHRDQLVEAGRERRTDFTAERAGSALAAAYRQAARA